MTLRHEFSVIQENEVERLPDYFTLIGASKFRATSASEFRANGASKNLFLKMNIS